MITPTPNFSEQPSGSWNIMSFFMASGFGRFGRTDGSGIFGMNSRIMSEEELVDARFRLMIVCRECFLHPQSQRRGGVRTGPGPRREIMEKHTVCVSPDPHLPWPLPCPVVLANICQRQASTFQILSFSFAQ